MSSEIAPTPTASENSRRKEKFFQYSPLVFSVYYFIPAFIIPITGLRLALVCFYFLAFIAIYIVAIEQPKKFWPALAMISLGAIASHANPGAQNFLIYACFFIGFSLPTKYLAPILVGVIALTFTLEHFYHYEFLYYSLFVLIGGPALGLWGLIIRLQVLAEAQERKSREEISQLAKTVERERIARDLHDVIGHTLSTITLKAELAHKLLQRNESTKSLQELEQLLDVARGGLKQVRDTISGVQRASLAEELAQLADKLRQRGLSVSIIGSPPALPTATENALGLILTELTTNILRHSNADSCEFTFMTDSHTLILRLCDNGSVERVQTGNGLAGINRRMEDLGGTVDINTDEGFCVSLTLTLVTS